MAKTDWKLEDVVRPEDMNAIGAEINSNTGAAAAAQTTANTAVSKADAAQTAANTASTKADNAQTTANNAQGTANTAVSKADAAQTTANQAQTTANTAVSRADAAQGTANTALARANASLPKDGSEVMTGNLTTSGTVTTTNEISYVIKNSGRRSVVVHNSSNGHVYISPSKSVDGQDWDYNKGLRINLSTGQLDVNGNVVWHSGNDGAASDLDAAKVAGFYPRYDASGDTILVRESSGNIRAASYNGYVPADIANVLPLNGTKEMTDNLTFPNNRGIVLKKADGSKGNVALHRSLLNDRIIVGDDAEAVYTWGGKKFWHDGLGASSIAENGYQKLPSGLILQWGIIEVNGEKIADYDLPTTFPNSSFGAIGSVYQSAGIQQKPVNINTIGNKIRVSNFDPFTVNVRYLAIGH